MNELKHYSEEEFQSYFDHSFTDDLRSFEQHIKVCDSCSETFKAYSLVWSFAKNELKTESLKIDLANTVTNMVFIKKESKPVFDKLIYGMIFCLALACLYLSIHYLLSNSIPAVFALLIIPFVLHLLLTYKEISMLIRKFS